MPQFRPLSETKFINDANLVAYYPLENTTDVKGGFNLTNNNSVAFSAAKFANGADLGASNTNKSLSVNSNLGITGLNNCTISGWVKLNAEKNSNSPSDNWDFVTLGTGANGMTAGFSYSYNGGSRRVYGFVYDGTLRAIYYPITLGTTNYHHYVLTKNGTNVSFYFDGIYVGSATAGGTSFSATTRFSIGVNESLATTFASATEDDFAILSRALSQQEVMDLYQGKTLGEYIPNTNTKGYWRLNGNSMDFSGNNNNGTDTNISYVPGRFGQCASFVRATPSYITISGGGTSLSFSGDFTLSAWVNLATTNGGGEVISKATGNGSTSNNYEFMVFPTNIQLAGVAGKYTDATVTVSTSTWHHVVVTKTSAQTVSIYLDGKALSTTKPAGNETYNTNSTQPYIGRRDDGAGNGYFNGLIDEVKAEPIAWTPQQVAKYYSMTKGRFGIL